MAAQSQGPVALNRTDKGQSCVVVANFNPDIDVPPAHRGFKNNWGQWLRVNVNDKGYHYKLENNVCYVRIYRGVEEMQGHIPAKYLRFGVERVEFSQWTVAFDEESGVHTATSQVQSAQRGPPENQLHLAIRNLWEAIRQNRDSIADEILMNERVRTQLFGPMSSHYAEDIYNSILPKAKALMADGDFDPLDLAKLPAVSENDPKCDGIYVIIYEGVGPVDITLVTGGNSVNNIDRQYWGQSEDMPVRDRRHIFDTNAPWKKHSRHYAAARKARKRSMVPIVLFGSPHKVLKNAERLDAAELTFICLFDSWYPHLLSSSVSLDLAGAYTMDYRAARVMHQVSQVAFQASQCRWRPGKLRGVNWATPIIKQGSVSAMWFRWYDESKGMFIYRSRRMIRRSPRGELRFYFINSTHAHRLELNVSATEAHQSTLSDVMVNIVIEVRCRNGQYFIHPAAYWRVPTVTRNPEFDKLSSLAIRAEYVDPESGQWRATYLERSNLFSETNGLLNQCRLGTIMFSTLEQISYTNRPSWLPGLERKVLMEVRSRHLFQDRRIRPLALTTKQWPHDRDRQAVANILRQKFPPPPQMNLDSGQFPRGHGYRTLVGGPPRKNVNNSYYESGGGGKARATCDICYSLNRTAGCSFNPNTGTCKECSLLGRPCTFSGGSIRGTAEKEALVTGGVLQELAIPTKASWVNSGQGGSGSLDEPPFDPSFEGEEHGGIDISG